MNSLILALVLGSPNVYADRPFIQVDNKECVFKMIKYNDIDNLIWTKGDCQALYDMCTKDFCKVEKIIQKDLYLLDTENVGRK